MNVLRFPIQLRTGKNQFMREERLKEREENEIVLDEDTNSIKNKTTVLGKFQSNLTQEMLKIKVFR